MGKLVIKKISPSISAQRLFKFGRQSSVRGVYEDKTPIETIKEEIPEEENKKEEKDIVMMDTKEKIALANQVLSEEAQIKAKRIKRDKGLIERKENTIILTEDNRELLKD